MAVEERTGGRTSRLEVRLVRRGFEDPDAAVERLAEPALHGLADDSLLLDALGATADPDLALLGLARLLEALDEPERHTLRDTLTTSKPLRDRLLGVLGASAALGDHLARHPADWHALVTFERHDIHPGPAEFRRALVERVLPKGWPRLPLRRLLILGGLAFHGGILLLLDAGVFPFAAVPM